MKIAYAAQHGAGGNEDERHVVEALQDLGHTVIEVAQTGSPAGIPKDADLLLFNHWYGVNLSWLKSLPIPKVGWYWDKAWNGREDWLRQVIPLCDLFFMTDETWGRSSGLPNVRYLRQGIGVRGEAQRGKPQPGKWPDIVFTGSPYGERAEWVRVMKSRHGKRFGVVQGVHGRELYDLCETARVVVAPPFPGDDGYDSNRIFLTLGSGGLLIHPKHKWVNREFKDGVHYVGYASDRKSVV